MKKRIFHNWGLKLMSLLLAFALWFLAAQINDPKDTVTFSGITVRLINTNLLEDENKVYEVMDNSDTVRVTIRAPKSITRDLRASDIVAVADVSKLTDINTIAISYSIQGVPSTSYDSVRGDHDTVRLNVEERASRWIRIQSQTAGQVAEGYQVMSYVADQTQISVTGPESAVKRIAYAGVDVDVSGATTSMSLNVAPKLYDTEGNLLELQSIVTNVDYVHMNVEVLAVKEVPVKLAVTGTPAEGYLATGQIDCSLENVKIAGLATALAGINSISIPAEQLDITGATENVANVINLKDYLKENVRLADNSFNGRITVTVYVEPVVERTIVLDEADFEFVNIPEGYELKLVAPDGGYKLTVSGLERDVSAVPGELIRGQVDVAAWLAEEGIEKPEERDYRIPVVLTLPENVSPEDVSMEDEITITVRFMKPEEI